MSSVAGATERLDRIDQCPHCLDARATVRIRCKGPGCARVFDACLDCSRKSKASIVWMAHRDHSPRCEGCGHTTEKIPAPKANRTAAAAGGR